MRKLIVLASLAALFCTSPALAAEIAPPPALAVEKPIAMISYAQGEVGLMRDGKPVAAHDIGDPVYDDDLVKTGNGGGLVLELAPSTGMRGSITLAAKSSIYLHLDLLAGERQNSVELIAGQLGIKVKRIVGSPGFKVATYNAVLGVRGTEFEVTSSPMGELLVTCSEGEVSCSSGDRTEAALPGQVVERREGQGLARHALADKDYAGFRAAWLAERTNAFRRDAARNAALLIGHYLELQTRVEAASRLFAADSDLRAWAESRKRGRPAEAPGDALDKAIARVAGRIEKDRDLLGAMERASAGLEAIQELLAAEPELAKAEAGRGLTVGQFLKRFAQEKARELEKAGSLRSGFKLLRLKQNLREELRFGQQAAPGATAPGATAPGAAAPASASPASMQAPAAPGSAPQDPKTQETGARTNGAQPAPPPESATPPVSGAPPATAAP